MLDVDLATFAQPYPGQRVSGDCAVIKEVDGGYFLGLVDVLGHGIEANAVAVPIERFLQNRGSGKPGDVLRELDGFLKGSRGAAAGLAFLETATGTITYAGIGNTVARILGGTGASLVSRDGIVGGNSRAPSLVTAKLDRRDILLMYTDGVRSNFARGDYPQVLSDTARTIAQQVVERFGKEHDDATCIAARYI